jgi:hypothetical protein
MSTAHVTSDQRLGLRVHEESIGLPFNQLVRGLRDVIGVRLVAYIGGVKSARSVSGRRVLRQAYQGPFYYGTNTRLFSHGLK